MIRPTDPPVISANVPAGLPSLCLVLRPEAYRQTDTAGMADQALELVRTWQSFLNRKSSEPQLCSRRWYRLQAGRNEAAGLVPEHHCPAMPDLVTGGHTCLLCRDWAGHPRDGPARRMIGSFRARPHMLLRV
jgi:hypothetical protein